MSIKPIDIQIENNWQYGLVTFLVDRGDFLQDIESARKKLGITKLFERSDIEKQFEEENQKWTRENYSEEQMKHFRSKGIKAFVAPSKYEDIAIELQKKYGKSDRFQNVIKFAILTGIITDKDLEKTDPIIWISNPSEQISSVTIRYPQIAIVIDPETNPDDVKVGVKKFANRIDSLPKYLIGQWKLHDTISTIKQARKWYWRNINGESPKKIAINDNKGEDYYGEAYEAVKQIAKLPEDKCAEFIEYLEEIERYSDKVDKAIKRYKKAISDT